MIDGILLDEIGIALMFCSAIISLTIIIFFDKHDKLGFILLITGLSIGSLLSVIAVIELAHEDQIKQAQEKLRIDSLSCQALGEYLLNNAGNYTYSDGSIKNHNFVYAQAKFLVCTHSLISRLSP